MIANVDGILDYQQKYYAYAILEPVTAIIAASMHWIDFPDNRSQVIEMSTSRQKAEATWITQSELWL